MACLTLTSDVVDSLDVRIHVRNICRKLLLDFVGETWLTEL